MCAAVRIRPLSEDEWRGWRELRLRLLHDAPHAFGSTYEQERTTDDAEWQRRTARFASAADRVMFVAEAGTGWAGCAGGIVHDGTHYVISVWVEPERRGQGLGEALVGAVAAWALGAGARRLKLWVARGNRPALELYERMGFRRTGATQAVRRGDSSLVEEEMAAELDHGA